MEIRGIVISTFLDRRIDAMTTRWIWPSLALVASCNTNSPPAATPPGSATPPPVVADAHVVDAMPTCDDEVRAIGHAQSDATRAFLAKEGHSAARAAENALGKIRPDCRDGEWYLAAAYLLAYVPGERELGGTKLASEAAALTAALGKPDVLDVLARVAYHAALGRPPALPADACARARATTEAATDADAVAYVCGQAALASGDGLVALEHLAAVRSRARWLDVELASARAAELAGNKPARKQHATLAAKVDARAADRAHVASGDARLVAERGRALLK